MKQWNLPSWPQWNEEEKAALSRVLDAGQWGTLGDEAMLFAQEFAAFIGVPYAIPVNNGTQALELLLRGGHGVTAMAAETVTIRHLLTAIITKHSQIPFQ